MAATDQQLTGLSLRHAMQLLVHDQHLCIGKGLPDYDTRLIPVYPLRQYAAGLGAAIAVDQDVTVTVRDETPQLLSRREDVDTPDIVILRHDSGKGCGQEDMRYALFSQKLIEILLILPRSLRRDAHSPSLADRAE